MQSVFSGPVFVVRDNIDTDQIIPAEHLNLVPTIPDEYEKLKTTWGIEAVLEKEIPEASEKAASKGNDEELPKSALEGFLEEVVKHVV